MKGDALMFISARERAAKGMGTDSRKKSSLHSKQIVAAIPNGPLALRCPTNTQGFVAARNREGASTPADKT